MSFLPLCGGLQCRPLAVHIDCRLLLGNKNPCRDPSFDLYGIHSASTCFVWDSTGNPAFTLPVALVKPFFFSCLMVVIGVQEILQLVPQVIPHPEHQDLLLLQLLEDLHHLKNYHLVKVCRPPTLLPNT